MSSSKLLLPALAAAARLVSGVLYVPLDYVERVTGTGRGGGAEGRAPGERRVSGASASAGKDEESRRNCCETMYLQEASQQVS